VATEHEGGGKHVGPFDRSKPEVGEVTLEQATRILNEKGFNRLIHVRRDLKTGKILDLFLRE
jgi:hypothetical protein